MSQERTPGGNPDDAEEGDARVGQSLRQLPAATASAGFTEGVLARTARPRARRFVLPALIGAAAAVGALALSRQMADPGSTQHRDVAALGDEIAQLRREQRELAAQIERLRAEDAEAGLPIIYVGQSAGVDVVLDLARFETALRPEAAPARTGVRHEGER